MELGWDEREADTSSARVNTDFFNANNGVPTRAGQATAKNIHCNWRDASQISDDEIAHRYTSWEFRPPNQARLPPISVCQDDAGGGGRLP